MLVVINIKNNMYIYMWVSVAKEAPRKWIDADLGSLKTFLMTERDAGRFKPQRGLPFDD